MYFCLCNALKEKDIAAARAQGGCSVSQIFSSLGCRPQCGQCVDQMRAELAIPSPAPTSPDIHPDTL